MQMEQHEPKMFRVRNVTYLLDIIPNNLLAHHLHLHLHFVLSKHLVDKEHPLFSAQSVVEHWLSIITQI